MQLRVLGFQLGKPCIALVFTGSALPLGKLAELPGCPTGRLVIGEGVAYRHASVYRIICLMVNVHRWCFQPDA